MRNVSKTLALSACAISLVNPVGSARAQPVTGQARPDFTFALVRHSGNWNPRPTGLLRLAWEILELPHRVYLPLVMKGY